MLLKSISNIHHHIIDNTVEMYIDVIDDCNFNCEYCCTYNYRKNTNTRLNLDALTKYINKYYDTYNLILSLYGGEPTLHPNLIQFCIKNYKHKISIHTNFLNSVELYKTLLLNNNVSISISFHTKAWSIDAFLNKLTQLHDFYNKIDIVVMYDPKLVYDTIKCFNKIYNFYVKNNISLKLLDISKILSNHSYFAVYTSKAELMFNKLHSSIPLNDCEKYNCIIDNNQKVILTEDDIFKIVNKNMFKNWLCSASIECIFINTLGNIYPCSAMYNYIINSNKYILGNIYTMKQHIKRKYLCPFTYYCNMPIVFKENVFKL